MLLLVLKVVNRLEDGLYTLHLDIDCWLVKRRGKVLWSGLYMDIVIEKLYIHFGFDSFEIVFL